MFHLNKNNKDVAKEKESRFQIFQDISGTIQSISIFLRGCITSVQSIQLCISSNIGDFTVYILKMATLYILTLTSIMYCI